MTDDSQTRFLEWVFDDFHQSFHRDRPAALVAAARRVAELDKKDAALLGIVFQQAKNRTRLLGSYLGHPSLVGLFLGALTAMILSGFFDSWWTLAPALMSAVLVLVSHHFHRRRGEAYAALSDICRAHYDA